MSKDPAFLMYPNDYLGGTMGFSLDQHGAYILLLFHQFNSGHFLEETARKIVGDTFNSIKHKFKIDSSLAFYNERLDNEMKKRAEHCSHQRENAMKRWGKNDKPLSGKKINVMQSHCQCNAVAMPLEDENEDENRDRIKDEFKKEREEIIAYLNLKAGTSYRPNSQATIEHINGRLNKREGRTVDDFKKVIDKKCSQWTSDIKMSKFLRPSTLFSPEHFENYLNEPEIKQQGGQNVSAGRQGTAGNRKNIGKPGYDESGNALGAVAKPGEFDEGIITLEGVPDHR